MTHIYHHIAIIGVGLVGASIAIAARHKNLANTISTYDASDEARAEARTLRIGDVVHDDITAAVREADLVVLAVPVGAMSHVMQEIAPHLPKGAVITDTGSTKTSVIKAVMPHVPDMCHFIAGHPMAGTEFSGPKAAHVKLFNGKTNIICDIEKTDEKLYKPVIKMMEAMGMKLTYMNSRDHDKHIAYVSHLSHITSFVLGQTVLEIEKEEKHIFNMAGSGFASTVRLAKSSPEMWAPIFEQNQEFML